jgi:tetratricopeptide (TPR) repeat protein
MKSKQPSPRNTIPGAVTAAYLGTLAAFFIASFFPDSRVWGLNIWAFFPLFVRLILVGAGLLVYAGAKFSADRWRSPLPQHGIEPKWKWYATAVGIVGAMSALFVIFRSNVHFLGDGYLVMTIVASPTPDISYREIGEYLAHLWMFNWLTGTPPERALQSYQLLSNISGASALSAVFVTATVLFDRIRERLLFVLCVATAGFMLLYFGYVEHYSLFSFSVVLFLCIALLILRRKLPRWLIAPVFGFAFFLHILAATLLPAAIYVLFENTSIGSSIARWRVGKKTIVAALFALPLIAAFVYFYRTDLFFRTAFVSPVAGRFTVDGYTLFSLKHLADMFNLMLIHLPGLALIAATLAMTPFRKLFEQAEYRFFALLLICVWGAAFIFEPKLGMPRDWDLFSFAGIPLAICGAYVVLAPRFRPPHYVSIALLVIALGALSLGPRVASQFTSEIGFTQVDKYAWLDPAKNKNLRLVTRDYFRAQGDPQAARGEEDKWASYPEESVLREADAAVNGGRNLEAVGIYNQALAINPLNIPTYIYLGQLFNRLGQFDSTVQIMEIARGLAPLNPGVNTTLGLAYWSTGRKAEGENLCRFAIRLYQGMAKPYYYLAHMCRESGRLDEYESNLAEAITKSDATAPMFADMASIKVTHGDFSRAAFYYRQALDKGLDSSVVKQEIQQHPNLSEYFQAP